MVDERRVRRLLQRVSEDVAYLAARARIEAFVTAVARWVG